jgi:hypothetical protein
MSQAHHKHSFRLVLWKLHTHTPFTIQRPFLISHFLFQKVEKSLGYFYLKCQRRFRCDSFKSNVIRMGGCCASTPNQRKKKKLHECLCGHSRPTRKAGANRVGISRHWPTNWTAPLCSCRFFTRYARIFFIFFFFCCWCHHDIFLTSSKLTTLFHHFYFHRMSIANFCRINYYKKEKVEEWMDDVIEMDN